MNIQCFLQMVDEALPVSMVPLGGFDVQTARDQAQREAFHEASEAAMLARENDVSL